MLTTYLDAISRGATPEEAAAKGFGDLKRLQSALETYIRSNSFYILKGGVPPEIPQSDLKVRELSDPGMDVYRGGFATIRGDGKDAVPILEQAVKADPKLALGYQYLGYAELQTGKRDEALADFSRAIELDPNNAITRFMRARLYVMSGGDQDKITTDLRRGDCGGPKFCSGLRNARGLPGGRPGKSAGGADPGEESYESRTWQFHLPV